MKRLKTCWFFGLAICSGYFFISPCGSQQQTATTRVPLKLMHRIPHRENVQKFLFSANGQIVAVVKYPVVEIWNARNWKLRRTLRQPGMEARTLSADGQSIVMQGGDLTLHRFNTSTGRILNTMPGVRLNLVFSRDGRLMAGTTGQWDGNVMHNAAIGIWNAGTGRRLKLFGAGTARVFGGFYVFSPDNRLLAAANEGIGEKTDVIAIYQVATGKLVCTAQGSGGATAPVVFAPNSRSFLTAGLDPKWKGCPPLPDEYSYGDGGCPVDYAFKSWDARSGKLIRAVSAAQTFSRPYKPVAFIDDGKSAIFTSGYSDYEFQIRTVPTGQLLYQGLRYSDSIEGPSQSRSISPDGTTMLELVGYGDGKSPSSICVWKIDLAGNR